jgi:hypothetical protein
MKTATLVIGLFQVALAVCGGLSCTAFGAGLAPLFALAAVVNAAVGTNSVMESLFGRGGLVCEVFGRSEGNGERVD